MNERSCLSTAETGDAFGAIGGHLPWHIEKAKQRPAKMKETVL